MTAPILTLEELLVTHTKEEIAEMALLVADSIGLPVSTWQPGDPTRSLLLLEAELLEKLDEIGAGLARSAFLETAKATPWMAVVADQVFGETADAATYATTTITLTNSGGGFYDFDPFALTVRNSTTGKTYHNTERIVLASGAGQTASGGIEADEPGSDSTAAAMEIDEIVSGDGAITCSNATAAIGLDAQDDDSLEEQCTDKLGSLSPDGPKEAYSYVARRYQLTGTKNVTRCRVYADSDTGDVDVYLAGPSGAVEEADRALVEDAIVRWANPLCNTPNVMSASNVTQAITYSLWVYKSVNRTETQIATDVAQALAVLFRKRPIGGDVIPPADGKLYKDLVESAIGAVYPKEQVARVTLTTPSGDVALTRGQVLALGTITPSIYILEDP